MATVGSGRGENAMSRYFLGFILVAFVMAISAPAFANRNCGPNSRACTVHHMYCTCGQSMAPKKGS